METFSALLAFCAGNSPVPMNSPHKDQWRGDLRRHRGHYDVNVMRNFIQEFVFGNYLSTLWLKLISNTIFTKPIWWYDANRYGNE